MEIFFIGVLADTWSQTNTTVGGDYMFWYSISGVKLLLTSLHTQKQ